MARDIQLKNKVYSKDQLDKVVDRNFVFFSDDLEVVDQPITVDEFFAAYEELYYEIPLKGENQSHQYLSQRSAELIDFEKDTTDIQPLLDEIATLREQLLTSQEEIIQLRNTQAGG